VKEKVFLNKRIKFFEKLKSYLKYKKTINFFTLIWLGFFASFYVSCASDVSGKKESTLTTGEVVIYADEAYTQILNDQRFIYQMKYPESNIQFVFTGEDEAMELLLNEKIQIAVVSEEPSPKIKDYFKKKGFALSICPIAKDGIVLLVNKNSPLEKLTKNQLKQLLSGEITSWNELLPDATIDQRLILGFNTRGSGIINYFRKNYLNTNEDFSANCATFDNTFCLLDSVSKQTNILGFIPYNFISDKDDSLTRAIKENFKVISLESLKDSNDFVLPSQSSIADSAYPLVRRVLVINHEGKSGLGTGFVIYMASHKGQRLMLKAGMVPAVMPGRLVRMINKNI
jgi:phosphate transport system substrate-binding protein